MAFFSIYVYCNLLQIGLATCFVNITLLNFSRQQFSHSVMVSLIAASVNRMNAVVVDQNDGHIERTIHLLSVL